MKILALEFSTHHRSVAAWETAAGRVGDRCAETHHPQGRSTPAFALIERTLAEAGFDRTQIERIAVGLGPGSSTGIRTAIAIAQGWQVGREVAVIGLSSLDVLAAQLQRAGQRGIVHLVTDAQRREYHVATFQLSETACEALQPLRLATAEEVRALLDRREAVWGPDLVCDFPESRGHPTAGELPDRLRGPAAGSSRHRNHPLSAARLRQSLTPTLLMTDGWSSAPTNTSG
ncbi:MAG: tRNA (adenosine(37)-N6)-threonylcarbamoyltransferase complex dimerization subunit type 1 TsaB [Verrucomicrobiales bacterium]|nr:tRNA (adenosine(37)-N6)-threonylcarbamoyltransferase complex dimerization subunit type 1 TsaB [Verrucomicrobiales bacterium]